MSIFWDHKKSDPLTNLYPCHMEIQDFTYIGLILLMISIIVSWTWKRRLLADKRRYDLPLYHLNKN